MLDTGYLLLDFSLDTAISYQQKQKRVGTMQYAAKDSVLIPCYPLCLYFILCCLLFTAYFGFAIRCELLL